MSDQNSTASEAGSGRGTQQPTPPKTGETRRILEGLEATLRCPGIWAQGGYRQASGRCILSLLNAQKKTWTQNRFVRQAEKLIEGGAGIPDGHLSLWNDEPGRTQADILRAVQKALGQ